MESLLMACNFIMRAIAYNALQVMEVCKNEEEAIRVLESLKLLDGYLGGRILKRSEVAKNKYEVQAFFEYDDQDEKYLEYLPEGVRPVIIPKGLAQSLGIKI